MATFRSPFARSPIATAVGILLFILVFYLFFTIVGWLVSLLYKIAPVFLIAALIIDHTVVLSYLRGIRNLFRRNPIYGLAAGAATIAFYPFVFLYFLGMALFKKKVKEARQESDAKQNGKWIDYEELPEDPIDIDTHYEELPPPPTKQRGREEPGYDEYFK